VENLQDNRSLSQDLNLVSSEQESEVLISRSVFPMRLVKHGRTDLNGRLRNTTK
jgi:hypothetical protein